MANEPVANDTVESSCNTETKQHQGLKFSDLFSRHSDPNMSERSMAKQEEMPGLPPGTTLVELSRNNAPFTADISWKGIACKPAHLPNSSQRFGSPVNCMALNPDLAQPDNVINKTMDYLDRSVNQVVLGNYTDDVTLLGTCAQIATGIFDLDLPADIRDLTYDVTHWEWSWGHFGQTVMDAVGLLPVAGAIKYGDEAAAVVKNGAKHVDDGADLSKKFDGIVDIDGPKKTLKKLNPLDDPKIAKEIKRDPNAVNGYSPKPGSSLDKFKIDWGNPKEVEFARSERIKYLEKLKKKKKLLENEVEMLKKEGMSMEDIARKKVQQRNQERIDSYLKSNNIEGLKAMKERNLIEYGRAEGPTAEQLFESKGSWEEVIFGSVKSSAAMDVLTGLY